MRSFNPGLPGGCEVRESPGGKKPFFARKTTELRDAGAGAGTAIAGFVRKGFPSPEYGRAQLGKSFRQQKVTVALFRAAQEERSRRSFAQVRDKSLRKMTE
jgi:hypothetical protein